MTSFNIKLHKLNYQHYQPFVKWVGGKRGLLEQIIPLFPIKFNNYHEPFVGGGAVFFELYSKEFLKNKKVILSDINEELIITYQVVKEKPLELIKRLEEYKENHSNEFYYEIRELDRKNNYKTLSPLEKATRFIYLNKTCFNGLYRVNKKGFFNVPIGRYKNPNIVDREIILSASEALQNVTILHQSFEKVLKYVKKGDFIYFDPPYYPLNKTSNFTSYNSNCFLEEEQIKLYNVFKELDKMGCYVALSNSDTIFIKELYKEYDINIVNANRFINSKSSGRGKISEVLVRNY
ncbi:MAG: DNA adenine methylase [Epsilonproteobacteria bacterium]|nr:DNA adenine methylase [Campylobacterota bacterium]